MNLHKTVVVLLTLLLAGMAMVPMVSATDNEDSTLSDSSADLSFDFEKVNLPDLVYDDKQEKIPVNSELTIAGTKGLKGIPSGAIIHHSANGITTVFDQDGKQIMVADDKESAIVPTPGGLKRATYVTEVPSGSHVINKGDITYVIKDNVLLLTILYENVNENILNERALNKESRAAAAADANYNGWLEYAYDDLAQIRQFDAYWTVPSHPPSSESAEPIFLFNGIRTPAETAIVQPVLEWNQPSTGLYWTGSSWALQDGMQNLMSTRLTANEGDTLRGRLGWHTANSEWVIQIYDQTNGQVRNLYSNYVPDTNVQVDVALEGWNIDDNSDVPGDTTFTNMVFKYNGNTVPVDLNRRTASGAPLTQLNVEILSNPSSVKLHTAN
jgi:hypothetical protein